MPVASMPPLPAQEPLPDDGKPKGQYKVRGQWYLEGDHHHDLIVPGAKCQVRCRAVAASTRVAGC